MQNQIEQNKGKTYNNIKHSEGHADHEEAQAGDQAAVVEAQ